MTREEALKVLRELHETALFSVRNALEVFCPELAEIEDEKIGEFLYDFIEACGWSEKQFPPRERCLAYLEKLKEQKPTPDWMPKFLDELRSKKNYFDWDEHRDIEGHILAIINWIAPNYFDRKGKEQEQPEVDLEREAVMFCIDKGINITPHQAEQIARHFYYLALKQKEESK